MLVTQSFPYYKNTRFNPTMSGDLHLGHVYLCLVNLCEARRRRGRFYVRFDDTQRHWRLFQSSPGELRARSEAAAADLDWLGVEVDEYQWQSEIADKAREDLRRIYGLEVPREPLTHDLCPAIVGEYNQPYAYTPALTLEKVWFDFLSEIGILIRGNDLLSEFSLYCYWADRLGVPQAQHVYVPRLLVGPDRRDPSFESATTLAKSSGALSVATFRAAGYSAAEVMELLRESCLKDAAGDWTLENVKTGPAVEAVPRAAPIGDLDLAGVGVWPVESEVSVMA